MAKSKSKPTEYLDYLDEDGLYRRYLIPPC
jgi:hypothetical protein